MRIVIETIAKCSVHKLDGLVTPPTVLTELVALLLLAVNIQFQNLRRHLHKLSAQASAFIFSMRFIIVITQRCDLIIKKTN